MRYIICIFICLGVLIPLQIQASISGEARQAFQRVQAYIDARMSLEEQLIFYPALTQKINLLLQNPAYQGDKKTRLQIIRSESYETIFDLEVKQDNALEYQKNREFSTSRMDSNLTSLIPYSDLQQKNPNFITYKRRFMLSDEGYQALYFSQFLSFQNSYGVPKGAGKQYGINIESTPLYLAEDGSYNFIPDYETKNLGNAALFYGLPEKFHLLQLLADDMRYDSQNTAQILEDIRATTLRITHNKSQEEKIEAIYAYILEHVEYSQDFSLVDLEIFSGLEAFTRGDAVCTGYVKLMAYMLAYAGISEFEVIRGQALDAPDFPEVGHAWIRIGDQYYDPTFDDPVGQQITKSPEEYRFFALPKDIFYANRYEYNDLPETFIDMPLEERIRHIRGQYALLAHQYGAEANAYPLLQESVFRKAYNFSLLDTLSFDDFIEKIPSAQFYMPTGRLQIDGRSYRLERLEYFVLSENNFLDILQQINYDMTSYTLIEWIYADGSSEWRLAYDLELRQ